MTAEDTPPVLIVTQIHHEGEDDFLWIVHTGPWPQSPATDISFSVSLDTGDRHWSEPIIEIDDLGGNIIQLTQQEARYLYGILGAAIETLKGEEMNNKGSLKMYCKNCPCRESSECRIGPRQIMETKDGSWNDRYPLMDNIETDWCYRGRQIMEEEELRQKYLDQRRKERDKQITEIKQAIWSKKVHGCPLLDTDIEEAKKALVELEQADIETEFGAPAHLSPMRPMW